MSRHTEIQNQYRGYVAAQEAVKKTRPGEVRVVYKHDETNNRSCSVKEAGEEVK